MKPTVGTNRAIELAEKLMKAGAAEPAVARRIERVLTRLNATPMALILEQVRPGDPISAKAKAIGVSRATYYYWLTGETRPNPKQAQRLARLTDFSVAEIRGLA